MRGEKRGRSSVDGDPTVKYERQKRAPTKRDKYEYKGDNTSKTAYSGIQPTGRKRKFRDETSHEHFQAANVHSGRITLKPRIIKGLFSKSKSSFPITGCDLPDLTFTEMNFLSKPHNKAREDANIILLDGHNSQGAQSRRYDKVRAQFGSSRNLLSAMEVSSARDHRYTDSIRSHDVTWQPRSRNEKLTRLPVSNSPLLRYGDIPWRVDHEDLRVEHYSPTRHIQNASPQISWPSSNIITMEMVSQSPTDYFEDDRMCNALSDNLRHGRMDIADESCSIDPTSSISNRILRKFTDRLLYNSVDTNDCHEICRTSRSTYLTLDDLKTMHQGQTAADTHSSSSPETQTRAAMRINKNQSVGTSRENSFRVGSSKGSPGVQNLAATNCRSSTVPWNRNFNYRSSNMMECLHISAKLCEDQNGENLGSSMKREIRDVPMIRHDFSSFDTQLSAWIPDTQGKTSSKTTQDQEPSLFDEICIRPQITIAQSDGLDTFDLQLLEHVKANGIDDKSTCSTLQFSPGHDNNASHFQNNYLAGQTRPESGNSRLEAVERLLGQSLDEIQVFNPFKQPRQTY